MSLDVAPPDPPSLRGPQPRAEYDAIGASDDEVGDDYRRAELAAVLADGAWADAFDEWALQTDLSEAEFETIRRHDLIDQFDLYWDPATDEVGYRAPSLSPEARVDVGEDEADLIEEELDTLGRTVSEVLENDYLLRDDDDEFGFFAGEEEEYGSRDEG